MCRTHRPVVIGITESWLQPSILDGEILLPGYTAYKNDRSDRIGGGCVLYVDAMLPSRAISQDTTSAESLFCELRPSKSVIVLVGLVYRPPSQAPTDFDATCEIIRTRLHTRHTNLLLMGDFNLPQATFDSTPEDTNPPACPLERFASDLHLTQHVEQATRFGSDGSSSRPDLIYSLTNHTWCRM